MISAQPAQPSDAEAVAGEPEAEDAREDGLHRERDRRPRGADPPLRPGLDEEAERAREDPGDEERAPDRPPVRHLDLAERDGDDGEAGERGEHLGLRERERVVAGRVALHQRDLERVGGRAGEHEQVAARIAGADAGEQRQPGDRERDTEPDRAADVRAEEEQAEQRREDDVEAGDEACARDGRPREPGRLQRVAEREQEAERDARDPAAPAQ